MYTKEDMIYQFKCISQNENLDSVFNSLNLATNFVYHNIFIHILETSFPLKSKKTGKIRNEWLTNGIKILYKYKKVHYTNSRDGNNPQLKSHYKTQ
jgi:hypothetical protein